MAAPPAAGPPIATLTIDARIDEISRATSWLAELAASEGWPEDVRFGLELSLEEALTNVISYGFPDRAVEPEIAVECYHLPRGRVELRLIDNGIAFDPTSIAEPGVPQSLEDAKIGGHGVQLMRHFLESLSYSRRQGKNELCLVAGSGAPAGEGA